MAIDYSQYAKYYAPGADAVGGKALGRGVEKLISGQMERKKWEPERYAKLTEREKEHYNIQLKREAEHYKLGRKRQKDIALENLAGVTPPTLDEEYLGAEMSVMGNNLMHSADFFTSSMFEPSGAFANPNLWGDLNISDGGSAYLDFIKNLDPQKKELYQRKGLLNPASFIQKYNQNVSIFGTEIIKNLEDYRVNNKLSVSELGKVIASKPGLFKLLKSIDMPNYPHIEEALLPTRTYGDVYKDMTSKYGSGPDEILGTAKDAAIGTAATYSAYRIGKGALKKFPKAKIIAKGVIPPVIANKSVGQVTSGISKLAGASPKTQALVQEGTELAMNGVLLALKKHGLPKIIKTVAKAKGWKFVAKTLGKYGIGALGTTATWGLSAPAMVLWSMKDLYDIHNIVKTMK
tara:strand:+ start:1760 stop:2974 length:1215 start_codon:yes stop_codon:yes gene_type:complete